MLQRWQCMVCGYIEEGTAPPGVCPVCEAPWTAFQRAAAEPEPPALVAPRPAGFRYVVVGNSAAGRSAAQAIRQVDAGASVTLLTEETVPLYYRPILPDYIGGATETTLFRAAKRLYGEEGLEILTGETVETLDTAGRVLRCRSGREVPYDSLLLATGSTPVTVPWPGSEAAGIAYFRTFEDAKTIASLCADTERAVVVGGGLLGLEFVRAFLARGLAVTLLVRGDRVGAPGLDPDAGGIIARRLAELGVEVGLNEEVVSIESANGRVTGVRTSRERVIPCGVVGVAVGVRPRIELAKAAGIACDRGILVDDRFETNVPGVFAAGDVAQGYDLACQASRVVTSWRVAQEQGRLAGWNMAGANLRSPGVVGANFQVFGDVAFVSIGNTNPAEGTARVEKELDAAAGKYSKRVYQGDRLVGAVLVGDTTSAYELELEIRGITTDTTGPRAGAPREAAPEFTITTASRKEPSPMRKMTEENAKAALAGESQAHIKYLNYAEKAKREGKENVARLFAAAAYAEQIHASAHLRVLKGIGTTEENLADAIAGEAFESDEMYPAYIAVAELQQERPARGSFNKALEAEKVHREMYTAALQAVQAGQDASAEAIFVCDVCGFTMDGEAPDECPICGATQDKFTKF